MNFGNDNNDSIISSGDNTSSDDVTTTKQPDNRLENDSSGKESKNGTSRDGSISKDQNEIGKPHRICIPSKSATVNPVTSEATATAIESQQTSIQPHPANEPNLKQKAIPSNVFLATLKNQECTNLTEALRVFIANSFAKPLPLQKQRKLTQNFLSQILAQSVKNPAFSELASTEEGYICIRDGWEKLTLTKLHDLVFGAPLTDEPLMCAHFDQKLSTFAWIKDRHLDLPFEILPHLTPASEELCRISSFRAPKDKLTILNNTMQIVVDIIRKVSKGNAGNDQILPVLVLLIVVSRPPKLISHIRYILRFRHPDEIHGLNGFCLTNMMGAVSFIYNMESSSLTLSEEEKEQFARNANLPDNNTIELAELSPVAQTPQTPQSSTHVGDTPPSIQIGDLASQVFQSTSGFVGFLFKEVKNIGEGATRGIDGVIDTVLGPPSPESEGTPSSSLYPGSQSTTSTSQSFPANELGEANATGTSEPNSPEKSWFSYIKRQASMPNFGVFNDGNPESGDADTKESVSGNLKQSASFEPPGSRPAGQVDEDYELQLALAMSLSLEEKQKRLVDNPVLQVEEYLKQGENLIDTKSESEALPTLAEGSSSASNTVQDEEQKKQMEESLI